jgi:hypothetical protein
MPRVGFRPFFTRGLPWVIGLLLGPVFLPTPALAIIQHWDPQEAFFIRQFSYLFFMLSMMIFIYELKQAKSPHRGFRLLVWGSVFFALWNFDCFLGQFFGRYLPPQVIEGAPDAWSERLNLGTQDNWIGYLTKLDHLLLVPAFFLFYLGLRAFRTEQQAGDS